MAALAADDVFQVREFKGDITKSEASVDFVRGLDAIVHLAGLNRAPDYDIMNVNSLGTLNLLNAIRSTNPRARLVVASSFQVYRQWGNRAPLDESIPPDPQSIYGLSKRFAEDLCRHYSSVGGTRTVILRLSNVFGPGCLPDYNSVVATFIDRALADRPVQINGDGSSLRDYIYIADVADSFRAAARADTGEAFSIYNVCSGTMTSLKDIVSLVGRFAGKSPGADYRAGSGEDHAFDPCSNAKALRDGILKQPLTDFAKAIELTVAEEKRRRAGSAS